MAWLQNSSRLAMARSQEQQNLHDAHPACCGLCALHAQPPCKDTYRKDACAGALLNPITDSDVNSATGISASIALTVSGVADSQSVHLEGGTTTRLRRSSPGRWDRPMIGWPSALMVSIENDTTISPVALPILAVDAPRHCFASLPAWLKKSLHRYKAELPLAPCGPVAGLFRHCLSSRVVGASPNAPVFGPTRDQSKHG